MGRVSESFPGPATPPGREGLVADVMQLLHKPNGTSFASAHPGVATAAAEVGELVLWHRIAVEGKKLSVIDQSPTGVAWMDEQLAAMARKSGPRGKPIKIASWLSGKGAAFTVHRQGLAEHGLLSYEKRKFLGFIPYHRFFPEPLVRDTLISELGRVARVERPIDNRLALLTAIVYATGLAHSLGFGRQERRMMKSIAKGEQLGGAVDEVVAATTVAIAAGASTASASGGDGGAGGDGGGGGGGG